jgi:hypothetical protein
MNSSKPPKKTTRPSPAPPKATAAAPATTKGTAATNTAAKPRAIGATAAKAGPCKITADPSGQYDFQVRAVDMPIAIKLCEDHQGTPATTSNLNLVTIRSLSTNPPTVVAGQPTGLTTTTFSLTLPVGAYYVGIVVNPLPSSTMAYVCEDCIGLTQLTHILTSVQQPSGYFTLRVV